MSGTKCGIAPREETVCGIGPAPALPSKPKPREDGRAIYTAAIQAVARLNGYARRSGRTELEAKALRAFEILLEVLP